MRVFRPDPGINISKKRALESPFSSPGFGCIAKAGHQLVLQSSMCTWLQFDVLDVKSRPVVCRYPVSMLIWVRNWLVQEGAAAIFSESRTRYTMLEVIIRRFPVSHQYMGIPTQVRHELHPGRDADSVDSRTALLATNHCFIVVYRWGARFLSQTIYHTAKLPFGSNIEVLPYWRGFTIQYVPGHSQIVASINCLVFQE